MLFSCKIRFEIMFAIAVDKNGNIIVCDYKNTGVLEFNKILSDGQQIHNADRGPSNIGSVMQVAIRQQDNSDRLCFFTIERQYMTFIKKIVQTRMKINWGMLRILFIAFFKPDENAIKTFALLPVIGKSGKYSPILKMIIDFVNT